ncbi:MAG: PQQ-dependent sugar dehydrogenase [Solirubrobacterales bacterium]
MRRPGPARLPPALLPVPAAALLLAAALLGGCGSSGSQETGAGGGGAQPPPATEAGTGGGAGTKLTKIGNFSEPTYVAQPPGERDALFVVEKTGAIRVVGDGRILPQPFLDIGGEVSGGSEQGLLSMAFSPNYASSGLFYVNYTNTEGDTRVVSYRRSSGDPLRADPRSARLVLAQDQPYDNHNGGQLEFGPGGKLYIGFGDGGSAGDPERNGQDRSTVLGKIVRLDPDDPEAGPEIYALGLRNPWRFSFDRQTSALAIGDVGQDRFEEIDYVRHPEPGMNFGWPAFEANARYNDDQQAPGAIPPVLSYGRSGGCSVTGGYVVRDPRLPRLQGHYLYGDYCAGQVREFLPPRKPGEEATGDRELGLEVPQLTSFGEDSRGRIYAASQAGPVYRIDPAG